MKKAKAEKLLNEIGAVKVDWKNAKMLKNGAKNNISNELAHLDELIGSTVADIGIVDVKQLPGKPYIEGGLIIDYDHPVGTCKSRGVLSPSRRIVLGFTELGMWVQWQGDR
jgi:hypothetical protein